MDIDLSVLQAEPAGDYHAKANEYLSSHQLMDFMKCPWLYRKKHKGLIEDKDSPAYLIGRAAHSRILEGRDAYESSFAMGGPINEKTGKPYGTQTKAFVQWRIEQGKPVLSHEQADLVENMASGVAMNDKAVDLLLYGRAEGVLRQSYCDIPCQVRIDWTHPHKGIVDLKTCDDLLWFEADAKRYHYAYQLAFYRAIFATAVKEDPENIPVHIVAVEKKEPYRCGVWRVSEPLLAITQRENEAAIRRLIACQAINHWPTGYEELRYLATAPRNF
ncbi:PD-(D/E)XK nuclease-like domain-containing protein [Poriferisphaera corsica]|uniref:PD-(D/E)XK nuclease-like domain-containing protein n=1 Tax=Poriferisphaera corsica TaxID=2528020 RepID=UPI00190D7757|nr:PD-(D/E)XK nuclease-like domain-containing protein [Poriferisphaera corsica]